MTERRTIPARRPPRHGGGACTLLLIRDGDRIELLPHAVDTWAAELDERAATELRDALDDLLG